MADETRPDVGGKPEPTGVDRFMLNPSGYQFPEIVDELRAAVSKKQDVAAAPVEDSAVASEPVNLDRHLEELAVEQAETGNSFGSMDD